MRHTVLDLFSGSGGLSLGFRMAGFTILQAIEIDKYCAETYRRNNPDVPTICGDLCDLSPETCSGEVYRFEDVGVLVGGPPCKGFSESNRRTRNLANNKNFLFREFFRFLREISPPWFVLENVPGIRTLAGGVLLNEILELSSSAGYEAKWRELNAVNFGVPQIRRRILVVGNRVGQPIRFPVPTHVREEAFVTVRDAISDLPILANGNNVDYCEYRVDASELAPFQSLMRAKNDRCIVQGNFVTKSAPAIIERYRHIRPGQNWEAIPESLMSNYKDRSRCHTGIYQRLDWGSPSRVIGNFRKNMLIHPEQDRGLSVREAARLQSFPDDYVFLGSIGFQQQQVADAVPPLLAYGVAKAILECDTECPESSARVVAAASCTRMSSSLQELAKTQGATTAVGIDGDSKPLQACIFNDKECLTTQL